MNPEPMTTTDAALAFADLRAAQRKGGNSAPAWTSEAISIFMHADDAGDGFDDRAVTILAAEVRRQAAVIKAINVIADMEPTISDDAREAIAMLAKGVTK